MTPIYTEENSINTLARQSQFDEGEAGVSTSAFFAEIRTLEWAASSFPWPDALTPLNSMEDQEWKEYLQYEARRRGVALKAIQQEETAARLRVGEDAIRAEELEPLAKTDEECERLLKDKEEYPF